MLRSGKHEYECYEKQLPLIVLNDKEWPLRTHRETWDDTSCGPSSNAVTGDSTATVHRRDARFHAVVASAMRALHVTRIAEYQRIVTCVAEQYIVLYIGRMPTVQSCLSEIYSAI